MAFETELNAVLRKYNICSICLQQSRFKGTRCQNCYNFKQKIDRLKQRHIEIATTVPLDVDALEASMKEYHELVLSRKWSY